MISSNSFSSSSTTSSLSSGTDGKDIPMHFNELKLYQSQHNLVSDYPILTVSEISEKDERYWERRRKNNAAAKRSRERRRQHDVAMEKQIQNLKLMNTILRNEVMFLHNQLTLQSLPVDNSEILSSTNAEEKYLQIDVFPNSFTENVSVMHNNSNELTDVFTNYNENINQSENSKPLSLGQNPLDLSFKVKIESGSTSSVNNANTSNSSKTSNLDQRYWDRRRRNNEAVRKCRQNKKARMQSSSNVIINITDNNNKSNGDNICSVDKVQIKTKIESITNELEKLKTQLQNSAISSTNVSVIGKINVKKEEIVPTNLPMTGIHINGDCKKALKWKNKLIEADQAEKEMMNQTRF